MLKFDTKKKYFYFNHHSAWEHAKFLGTLINVVSKRVYYKFNTSSHEVLLTEKQVSMYIRNT